MKEFKIQVKDASGIHARPAGLLVKEASKYKKRQKAYSALFKIKKNCCKKNSQQFFAF